MFTSLKSKKGFIHPLFKKSGGFTLIELLIVIAIISIISAVVFVALDPLTRFKDARDSTRWSDITAVLSAIKIDQIDNGGSYLVAITSMGAGSVYMIGTDTSNCNSYTCDTSVSGATYCVNLTGLVTEGYLGSVPISPNGSGSWTSGHTGYTLQRDTTGIITVRACESENSDEIWLAR